MAFVWLLLCICLPLALVSDTALLEYLPYRKDDDEAARDFARIPTSPSGLSALASTFAASA